ncbi:MAG: polyprenyl synthetase family protein [Bacteroidaceae bacterium]|nr:polyprenyl synthetase family protein [Bacteroidaceae bacterium]
MDYRKQICAPIEAEFDEFRSRYSSLFSCPNPAVDLLLKFLLRRNGKMMRPILALLVSKCYGQIPESAYHLAAAVELLHQGSLIHDDVVDESEQRRGRRSANAAFDNRMAVLLGDYVVSMALQQITATNDIKSVDTLSELIGTLSEGEINQLNALNYTSLSEDVYFDIILKKTAVLFSSCTSLSAHLSGASAGDIEAFRQFGHIAGLCFQIMDDILDYHDSTETGKPSGNDMKEGKFTLPAIYALTHSDKDWSNHIKAVRSLTATPDQIREITDYTLSNGGIDYSFSKMEDLKKQAIQGLPAFLSPELRIAFTSYLELITNRSN